jgi:hypothetical protein
MAPNITIELILTCIDSQSCKVFFEPEGAVIELKAGEVFKVEIEGPGPAVPEISYVPDGIMVSAWAGADTRAWTQAGERLKI